MKENSCSGLPTFKEIPRRRWPVERVTLLIPIDNGIGTQSWARVLSMNNTEAHRYTVENECIVNPTETSIFHQTHAIW